MSKEVIYRGLDVGFGNTKYTTGPNSKEGIPCDLFASVTPKWSGRSLGGDFLSGSNTTVVSVGGINYEVGPDAINEIKSTDARTLESNFALSDRYMALVRGALHYMKVPYIDQLVMGLPVSSVEVLSDKLKERMTGVHELRDRSVEVRNVRVIAQPIGGMIECGFRSGTMLQLQSQTNLMIDPGFNTLDWLVSVGMKLVMSKSDSEENAGMAGILRKIGESVSRGISIELKEKAEINETILNRIDHAIRKGQTKIMYMGREIDLVPHFRVGRECVEEAVEKMVSKIGSKADIDNIFLFGGSEHLFRETIGKQFPNRKIITAKDPVFANVRGMSIVAQKQARDLGGNV